MHVLKAVQAVGKFNPRAGARKTRPARAVN